MTEPVGPGRVLGGRYRLEALVARGGMASVWAAQDPLLSRRVAVKLLEPPLGDDTALRSRFRREAVAAAALTHPNVVATYDTGEDDGIAYIVMELVDGTTLRRLLDGAGPLPVRHAVAIATEIAEALDHAHARGLVHRDVKPGNVLVRDDGHVKVTDFGIAKATSAEGDLTRAGAVVGTARYLAPEQLDGKPADERTDVYALALVLYEMLTGRLPFTGDTEVAAAVARLTGEPPSLATARPELPTGLVTAVGHALARDPAARTSSARAFRDAIAPYRIHDAALSDATRPVPLTSALVVDDDLPRAAVPPRGLRRRAVVGLLALAAGLGGGYAITRAALGPEEAAATRRLPPRVTSAPLALAGAQDFDPLGDGHEDHADVAKAIDGNEATHWSTEHYETPAFGNAKRGVGLRLDLAAPHTVRAIEVDAQQAGWSAQVYVSETGWTSAPAGPPTAQGADLGVRARLTLPTPTPGAHVLLWLTRLPAGGLLQISEVRVLG